MRVLLVVVVAAPHLTPLEAVYNRAAYCAVSYLAIFNDCDDLTWADLRIRKRYY